MMIDTNTIVSMTEANQNFSLVTRIVDQYGTAVIFKNNKPRYRVVEIEDEDNDFTQLILGIAAGEISAEQLLAWLQAHVV